MNVWKIETARTRNHHVPVMPRDHELENGFYVEEEPPTADDDWEIVFQDDDETEWLRAQIREGLTMPTRIISSRMKLDLVEAIDSFAAAHGLNALDRARPRPQRPVRSANFSRTHRPGSFYRDVSGNSRLADMDFEP